MMVNSFLKDECTTCDQKYRWGLAIQKSMSQNEDIHIQLRKKRRKIVEREFKCEYDGCDKHYCSIDALALHVKRKHPQEFNSFGLNRKKLKRSVADKIKSESTMDIQTFSRKFIKCDEKDSVCKSSKSTSIRSSAGSSERKIDFTMLNGSLQMMEPQTQFTTTLNMGTILSEF